MNTLSSPCPERELLLHSFADGELDAANALAMEGHLQNCAQCTAAYSEILSQKDLFKNNGLRFRAPDALRERVLAAIAAEGKMEGTHAERGTAWARVQQRTPWRLPFAKVGASLSAMALAASLILFVSSWNWAPNSIENELIAEHVRSLLVSHLTDVASSDQHTVKPWFLGKIDFAPSVIDLAQKNFPLIGGRLDYIGGRVVPALVYKRHGHVINLFVWPEGKAVGSTATLEGYHIVSWSQGGFVYAAVSDLNLPELREFQRALESSLS